MGYTAPAMALLEAAALAEKLDEGFIALDGKHAVDSFVTACRNLRLWEREPRTKAKDDKPPANKSPKQKR